MSTFVYASAVMNEESSERQKVTHEDRRWQKAKGLEEKRRNNRYHDDRIEGDTIVRVKRCPVKEVMKGV